MAKTVRSRKAKGRTFQKEVARKIRERFHLGNSDAVSTAASVGGVDILLSDLAKNVFPFAVECKKREKLNIWQAIEQSEKYKGDGVPLLVFSRNHAETYVTMNFDDFLALVKYGVGGIKNVSE